MVFYSFPSHITVRRGAPNAHNHPCHEPMRTNGRRASGSLCCSASSAITSTTGIEAAQPLPAIHHWLRRKTRTLPAPFPLHPPQTPPADHAARRLSAPSPPLTTDAHDDEPSSAIPLL